MKSEQIEKPQKIDILGSRILVVNDWSPAAVRAIAVGLQFVKAAGADMVVLNVNGMKILPKPSYSDLTILNIPANGASSSMRALFEEYLIPAIESEFPTVTVLSVEGDPASEIVKAAFDAEAALIIIADGGDRKEERLRSNDTACKVMKFAACSVLVVREMSEELNLPPVDVRGRSRATPAAGGRVTEGACELPAI